MKFMLLTFNFCFGNKPFCYLTNQLHGAESVVRSCRLPMYPGNYPRLMGRGEVHCRLHKCSPLILILNQTDRDDTLPPCVYKILISFSFV